MDRAKPQQLPPAIPVEAAITKPAPRMSVQESLSRAVQKEKDAKDVRSAVGFLDRFVRLFADYSHHSGRHHKRGAIAASKRTSDEIIGELRAFQNQKPRPWRPAGNRPKPEHKVRYRYRRAA